MGLLQADWIDNVKLRRLTGRPTMCRRTAVNSLPCLFPILPETPVSRQFAGRPAEHRAGAPGRIRGGGRLQHVERQAGFELTYYSKIIDNFLMQASLPASSGYASEWVNAGNLRNRGVELA